MERYTSAAVALMIAIIFAGGLLGCGSSNSQFVGKWVGKRTLAQQPENPALAAALAHVELHLTRDGEFLIKEAGVPKMGRFRVERGVAILRIETYMGKPIEALGSSAVEMNQPIRLSIQSDGSATLDDPTGFDPAPLKLRRTSETPEIRKR